MTDSSMTLSEYLNKVGVDPNGDFLREGLRLLAQMTMDLEVSKRTSRVPAPARSMSWCKRWGWMVSTRAPYRRHAGRWMLRSTPFGIGR